MDLFLTLLMLVGSVFVVAKVFLRERKRDAETLEEELEQDFVEDFEIGEDGAPSEHGMKELVEWMEDDLRWRRLQESEEVESAEELPPDPEGRG